MIINDSFRKLIPPLTPDEYAQLEANCLADGIRDPLVVWKGVLIDGHNRLAIAEKHGLDYTVVEKEFEDENHVKIWMIRNQKGRRNLTDGWKYMLAETEKTIQMEIGAAIRKATVGRPKQTEVVDESQEKLLSTIDNNFQPEQVEKQKHNTREIIAESLGWSTGKVAMADRVFKSEKPEIKAAVLSGEKSINEAYKEIKIEEKKAIVAEKEAEYVAKIAETTIFDVDIFNTDKKFNIIYADPAWSYWESGEKNQSMHYKTMGIDDIKNLPVSDIADENAILFIWVTYPILQEAFEVIKSWGFKYSTCGFAWVKKNKVSESWFFGNGAWTRANTELCLIATRGTVTRLDASISQVLDDRIMEHSQKPERVRELITRLVGKLPRIELFSRNTKNDGWFNWGNGI